MRFVPFNHWSLTTRITLGWLVITVGLLFTFAWFSLRGSREYAVERGQALLTHETETAQVRMQTAVQGIARDALFLAQGPAVRDFLASGDADSRRRMEAEFRALLSSKSDYFQVRLLDLTPAGNELVRLDHADGVTTVIPADQLQAKGDRDYFMESLPLATGEIYLSDINLNRDFGKITLPHIPTLRAATKAIPSEQDTPRGLIVINADLRALFRSLTVGKNPAVDLEIANEVGDFILHADPAKLYGTDLETPHRFHDLSGKGTGLQFETVFPMIPQHHRQASLRVNLAPAELAAGTERASRKALVGTLVAGVASLVLVVMFARLVARKLHHLAEAVVEYQPGQELAELPPLGQDEIGLLAGKFQSLASRVREDLVRIDQARREAEAATQAREDFLAMMSHEIRTPLNSVVGLLRTLERNRPSPHQQPILDALGIATRQLLQMVNEALDHSKMAAGKMEFHAAPFSLHALLRDAALAYTPQARQKGVAFSSEISPDLPDWVQGDAVRLNQVINNLLANALKFTSSGTITLRAAMSPQAELLLEIEDTGIGIAPEHIDRVFQPFDQGQGDTFQRFGGTGLGLALARQVVALQGGTLLVSSKGRDQGACFTLRLPLPLATPPSPQVKSPGALPDWSGLRFLYIEDVASNQVIMELLLAETGVTLEMASTGEEGLRKWLASPPDAVLVDVQLPDTDGITLATKALETLPKSRCWAVTAQVTAETRAACQAAGMIGLISKPIEASVFFSELLPHFPGTPSPASAMKQLFKNDPVRRRRVMAALAVEFQKHQATLSAATAAGDAEALRKLRHQLHTAISQFHLAKLADALDRLVADPADHSAQQLALACLADAERLMQASEE